MNDIELVRQALEDLAAYECEWHGRTRYHQAVEVAAALARIEQREALLTDLADAARSIPYEHQPEHLRTAISRWFLRQ